MFKLKNRAKQTATFVSNGVDPDHYVIAGGTAPAGFKLVQLSLDDESFIVAEHPSGAWAIRRVSRKTIGGVAALQVITTLESDGMLSDGDAVTLYCDIPASQYALISPTAVDFTATTPDATPLDVDPVSETGAVLDHGCAELLVFAQDGSGDAKAWRVQVAIQMGGSVLGTPTVTALGGTAGAASWALAVGGMTGLRLTLTGSAGVVHWRTTGTFCPAYEG